MQSYWLLKQVVYTVTTRLWRAEAWTEMIQVRANTKKQVLRKNLSTFSVPLKLYQHCHSSHSATEVPTQVCEQTSQPLCTPSVPITFSVFTRHEKIWRWTPPFGLGISSSTHVKKCPAKLRNVFHNSVDFTLMQSLSTPEPSFLSEVH
jgi:hypothetical protein